MNRFRIVFPVLALIAALPAQEGVQTQSPFYPVSVWYSGGKARAPMLEEVSGESARLWKEDLLKIKGLGFNTVRTGVEWNVDEPREGEYHLENLDLLLRLADEVGLKVIVQVYVDSAPEWVGTKYPEGRYAAQDGLPIPSQAAPGFCFDNENVRQAMLVFFRARCRDLDGRKCLVCGRVQSTQESKLR
jgi:glycosyl hydrolase family 42 (putative beta-galactosidase)